MLLNIVIGAILMVATTVIHAGGMTFAMHIIKKRAPMHMMKKHDMDLNLLSGWKRVSKVGGIILLMFNVSILEVLLWAYTYRLLDAIDGFQKAFYFSMVTFTTLGYGDIVLQERWRILSSFEAANGIIMFGWTTAIVIAIVQRLYFSKEP
jgi:hypothetical protein